MDSTTLSVGPASIQVTSGVNSFAPVAWLRARPAVGLAIAGAAAWALFGSKAVGGTLLAAAGALWLLDVTAPPPASSVTLQYGGGALTLQ